MYVGMRKKTGELKVPTNVYLIHKYKQAYEEKHGEGRISELVNAILREEYEKEKNQEAQQHQQLQECDVLGLNSIRVTAKSPEQQRQLTLFESYDAISKYIHGLNDVQQLAKIEHTGKVVMQVAHTRKQKIIHKGVEI